MTVNHNNFRYLKPDSDEAEPTENPDALDDNEEQASTSSKTPTSKMDKLKSKCEKEQKKQKKHQEAMKSEHPFEEDLKKVKARNNAKKIEKAKALEIPDYEDQEEA